MKGCVHKDFPRAHKQPVHYRVVFEAEASTQCFCFGVFPGNCFDQGNSTFWRRARLEHWFWDWRENATKMALKTVFKRVSLGMSRRDTPRFVRTYLILYTLSIILYIKQGKDWR